MTFAGLVSLFIGIINSAIPLVFGLALVFTFWKIIDAWIIGGGDPNKIEQGKKTVLIAVIVLTIMTSVWGILNVLQNSLF